MNFGAIFTKDLTSVSMLGGGGSAYDWYVDSVNGNDANTGTSPGQAFATLDALQAVVSSDQTIGLARGSLFDNQRLYLSASITGVSIQAYGSGNKPIIDGSATHTNWDKTAGQTNVYEKTLSLTADPSGYVQAFEDGVFMIRVANVATCDSTPGSYTATGETTDTITVYIHTSDSGNPDTNGGEYRLSEQLAPLHLYDSSDVSIYNIVAQRTRHKQAVIYGSHRMYAEGCEFKQGARHISTTAVSGTSQYKNCVFTDMYWPSENSALIAFYETTTDSADHVIVDGCTLSNSGGVGTNNVGAILAHDSGSSIFGSVTVTNCVFTDITTAIAVPGGGITVTVAGITATRVSSLAVYNTGGDTNISISDITMDQNSTATTAISLTGTGVFDLDRITIVNGGTVGIATTNASTLSIDDCSITGAATGYDINCAGALTNCIAISCTTYGLDIKPTSGTATLVTCDSDRKNILEPSAGATVNVTGSADTAINAISLRGAGTISLTGLHANYYATHACAVDGGTPTLNLTDCIITGKALSNYYGCFITAAATVTVYGGGFYVDDDPANSGANGLWANTNAGATVVIGGAADKSVRFEVRGPVKIYGGNTLSTCDYSSYGSMAFFWQDPLAGYAGFANWQAAGWDVHGSKDA